MKRYRYLCGIFAFILSTSSLAYTLGPCLLGPDYSWVGALALGPSWNLTHDPQTIFLTPQIEKTYTANNVSSNFLNGEIFIGLQKSITQRFQGQLGLSFVAAGGAKFRGNIWDDAEPAFNNYTYHYKVSHMHVALQGKLLMDNIYCFIPWISASGGIGFNRAYSFNNYPIIFEAVSNANFTSHNTTCFTYSVGAGVQRPFNKNWQVGVGYEFADWGKSQLGPAAGQTQGNGLTSNHLYTNSILFNVTYLS